MRLGKSYSSYIRSIEDMVSAIKVLELKLELGTDGRPKWGEYHTFKHEFKRVKFSLSRRQYQDSMTRIEKNNDILANLTDQNIELEPARKRRRRPSGLQFKTIQEHAKNLYSVISKGWTSCECGRSHQANLHLDPRLPDEDADLLEASHVKLSQSSNFKVVFSIEGKSHSPSISWSWQETEIRFLNQKTEKISPAPVMQEMQNPPIVRNISGKGIEATTYSPFSKTSKPKPKKGVRFVDPIPQEIVVDESTVSKEEVVDLRQIENLCLAMQQCMGNIAHSQGCLGYLNHDNQHRLGIYLPQIPRPPSSQQKVTSLANLLASTQLAQNRLLIASGNQALSRGDRFGLALTVASSVLQLYNTPWLPERWDKNDILINASSSVNGIRDQAFVSQSFPAITSRLPSEENTKQIISPIRNVTLFALGIVLIELCLGQALESLRSVEDPLDAAGEVNVLTDCSTAHRMMEAVYSEGGTRYGDAVRRCLYCEFDQRNTSLDNDAFRQAVYDGVVAPLEDNVKDFYQR